MDINTDISSCYSVQHVEVSNSDNEFIRWCEYALQFTSDLAYSNLDCEQCKIIKSILEMGFVNE